MFDKYEELMKKLDPEITYIDFAKYYRESYVTGGGGINPDSIFSTLNDMGFFIKTLIVKGKYSEPKLDNQGRIEENNVIMKLNNQYYLLIIKQGMVAKCR